MLGMDQGLFLLFHNEQIKKHCLCSVLLFYRKARRKRLEVQEVKGKTRFSVLLLLCSSRFLSGLQQNRAQASFFISFTIRNALNSPRIASYFLKQTLFSQRTRVSSACSTLKKHAWISQSQSFLHPCKKNLIYSNFIYSVQVWCKKCKIRLNQGQRW